MKTVRDALMTALTRRGETWENIVSSTLTETQLAAKFVPATRGGFGDPLPPFTVWTRDRVFFPAQVDTTCWIQDISRNPDGKPTEPVGS